jgi:uncharacterized linocin/CFP29 family protein
VYKLPELVTINSVGGFIDSMPGNMASNFLRSGLKINSLRTNGLLRRDEWEEIDTQVLKIATEQLIGIADLRSRGLIKKLGGLGTLISSYEKLSGMTEANVSMDGLSKGHEDDQEHDIASVPVPIIHKEFRLNLRRLENTRRSGDSLETTGAEESARVVAVKLEDMLFNGHSAVVDGKSIYGYTTHPDRLIGIAVGAWSTPANAYNTVLTMVQDARDRHMNGPWFLYISADQFTSLLVPYQSGSDKTTLQWIKDIPNLLEVKFSDRLTANTCVLVQMTSNVVDLAVAQDIVPIEWQSEGGMVSHYKTMCCMVPRIKSDFDGNCGVVHYTGLDGSGS